jgi:Uma2 family endonuclease
MAMPSASEEVQYLDGLLERLGVPASRVLLVPAPGTATEQDILDFQRRTGRICELVEGTLVEKPAGYSESVIAGEILSLIGNFNRQHRLGVVTGEQGTMRLMPGLVRIPDVAFVKMEKFPGGELPSEPIPTLSPDLAVEVLSESNTPQEMERKCREYFLAGAEIVWLVDVPARQVTVYLARGDQRVCTEEDTLDGGSVLPGFVLPVRDIFAPFRLASQPAPKARSRRKKKD